MAFPAPLHDLYKELLRICVGWLIGVELRIKELGTVICSQQFQLNMFYEIRRSSNFDQYTPAPKIHYHDEMQQLGKLLLSLYIDLLEIIVWHLDNISLLHIRITQTNM